MKLNRREETILNRLRMGNTNISHSHRFDANNAEQAPICIWGRNAVLGVKYMLLKCLRLEGARQVYFGKGRGAANVTLQVVLGENCNVATWVKILDNNWSIR